jgi:branched-subunit amino acid aminotransferase/4-amino-4-deoxychorismate lyase
VVIESITQPIAYLNGEFPPDRELAIPVIDTGFVLGATIVEQVRTFAGRPFWLQQHLQRFRRGLEIARIDPGISNARLVQIGMQLIRHNHPLLEKGHDLGICFFVTPGPYPAFKPQGKIEPTVCVHTFPLGFELWASAYEQGCSGRIVETRTVPDNCWPSEIKCRSRMHFFLASQAARRADPTAIPILLDQKGNVAETPTANVVLFAGGEGLVSPAIDGVLPGISRAYVHQLARRLGINFASRTVSVEDLQGADELFLVSTPFCIVPMVRIDGRPIGSGRPGALFRTILDEWSKDVGLPIDQQATRFAGQARPAGTR